MRTYRIVRCKIGRLLVDPQDVAPVGVSLAHALIFVEPVGNTRNGRNMEEDEKRYPGQRCSTMPMDSGGGDGDLEDDDDAIFRSTHREREKPGLQEEFFFGRWEEPPIDDNKIMIPSSSWGTTSKTANKSRSNL
ncbi:unnamed protein product [Caenorhabditis auriculariae]|uniref:Uncharacterized protein n=1 Tax=Caenorhabditis auriculariae TaxID=2777116 RepID=A0A8S1HHT1_9PELO|nr:unnamed protein product [Caenorhabditis auriculariae]